MRRSPTLVVAFFLFVTLSRVAALVGLVSANRTWGVAIAVGLGVGLYVAGFYLAREKTAGYAIAPSLVMLVADLWLNEAELILSVSQLTLVSEDANFLQWEQSQLEGLLQATVLMVGALPTLSAFLFGILQGGVFAKEDPDEWDIAFEKLFTAVSTKVRIGIIQQVERLLQVGNTYGNSNSPSRKKTAIWRYPELSGSEKAEIAQMTTGQIKVKYPGISDKTAYNWQRDAKAGK